MSDKKQFDVEKQKDKIRKILRKAEGTDNPEEQRTFTEAAERMMLRLGVTIAELQAGGELPPQAVAQHHRDFKKMRVEMVNFMHRISRGYGNITVIREDLRGGICRAYFIGVSSDVDQFLELVDSLSLQVPAALLNWTRENEEYSFLTGHSKYIARRSFIDGYSAIVAKRLNEMRKEVEAEATPGAALVLYDKAALVKAYVEQEHPDLKKTHQRSRSLDAAAAGIAAGMEANLGGRSASLGNGAVAELS